MNSYPPPKKAAPAAFCGRLPEPHATPIPDALANFDRLPDSAFVRRPVVRALFQVSTATVWRWSKSSRIPSPRRLSEGVTAWNVGELRKALRGEAWK